MIYYEFVRIPKIIQQKDRDIQSKNFISFSVYIFQSKDIISNIKQSNELYSHNAIVYIVQIYTYASQHVVK